MCREQSERPLKQSRAAGSAVSPGGTGIPRDGFAFARHDVRKGQRQGNRQRLTERTLPAPLLRTACAVTKSAQQNVSPLTSLRGVLRSHRRSNLARLAPRFPCRTAIPRDGFASARHDVERGSGEAIGSALRSELCQRRSHAPPVPYRAAATNVSPWTSLRGESRKRPPKQSRAAGSAGFPCTTAIPPPRHCEASCDSDR